MTTPGDRIHDARVLGGPAIGNVDRLRNFTARRLTEDRGSLPVVDGAQVAGELDVDRQSVRPSDLELVDCRVVEGGGETRQAGLREQLGETSFGLTWI